MKGFHLSHPNLIFFKKLPLSPQGGWVERLTSSRWRDFLSLANHSDSPCQSQAKYGPPGCKRIGIKKRRFLAGRGFQRFRYGTDHLAMENMVRLMKTKFWVPRSDHAKCLHSAERGRGFGHSGIVKIKNGNFNSTLSHSITKIVSALFRGLVGVPPAFVPGENLLPKVLNGDHPFWQDKSE